MPGTELIDKFIEDTGFLNEGNLDGPEAIVALTDATARLVDFTDERSSTVFQHLGSPEFLNGLTALREDIGGKVVLLAEVQGTEAAELGRFVEFPDVPLVAKGYAAKREDAPEVSTSLSVSLENRGHQTREIPILEASASLSVQEAGTRLTLNVTRSAMITDLFPEGTSPVGPEVKTKTLVFSGLDGLRRFRGIRQYVAGEDDTELLLAMAIQHHKDIGRPMSIQELTGQRGQDLVVGLAASRVAIASEGLFGENHEAAADEIAGLSVVMDSLDVPSHTAMIEISIATRQRQEKATSEILGIFRSATQ